MNPFDTLLVSHMVGDILFQSRYEAVNKAKSLFLASTHAAKWTFFIGLGSWLSGWNFNDHYGLLLLLMGVVHALLDWRKAQVIGWLYKVVEYIPPGKPGLIQAPGWLAIWADQVLHLVQLAILAYVLQ